MSNDQITTTTTQWYFSRIKDALAWIIIGPIIIFFACTTLWTNEWRNAHMQSGLKEWRSTLQEARTDTLDPALDGSLIHLTGNAVATDTLFDRDFGIEFAGVRLERRVEMYQWKEKSESKSTDNYGGSQTTTTTYTYSKVWDDSPINSSSFHEKAWHENPSNWNYSSLEQSAKDVRLGAYALSTPVIERIPAETTLPLVKYSPTLSSGTEIIGDSIYITKNPQDPQIGDMRITYTTAENGILLSILAKQTGNTLSSYIAKSGADITRVEVWTQTADEMFQHATDENTLITWLWRIGGLLFIFIGFSLFFRIIPILAKVIPPLAWLIGASVGLLSFLITVILGGAIIILAWFAYRPLISLAILWGCIVIGWWVYYLMHRDKNALTPPVPPPVP